jgi:hypothetical protein
MTKLTSVMAASVLLGCLGGCASLPDATIGYYLPQTKVSFKVVRTMACDVNNYLIIASAVTPTVTHSADPDSYKEIALKSLKGDLSDTDVKFDFFDDGRLKGINASSTGEGEAILKAVITVASAAALAVKDNAPKPKECAAIKKAGGDKPLTLTYESEVDIKTLSPATQPLKADPLSEVYIGAGTPGSLVPAIGIVCAIVDGTAGAMHYPTYNPQSGDVPLHVRQPGLAKVRVTAGPSKEQCTSTKLWEGKVQVAQVGTPYDLPIPKAVTFGKEVFAAVFTESGAITTLQYTSNTGAAQVLNVTNSALTAAQGETTAQKAQDVKAEADLIAQHQRLVQCLADPKGCK